MFNAEESFSRVSNVVKHAPFSILHICCGSTPIISAWYKKLKNFQNLEYATELLKEINSRKNNYIDYKTKKRLQKLLNLNFLKRLFYIDKTIQNRVIYQIFGFKIKIRV